MTDTDSSTSTNSTTPQTALMPWLRLMRLPTVFTALSNILCGYFVTAAPVPLAELLMQPELILLLLSSAGLYLGGMVLNDVYDAELDAIERPSRPIPSGQISRQAASVFAGTLMVGGIAAAAAVSGLRNSGAILIAIALAAAVFVYDSHLKNTERAPFGMAACRFLNVMLGASAVGPISEIWVRPQLLIAASLGLYVFGVTWFARNETGEASRRSLYSALVATLLGLSVDIVAAVQQMAESRAATGTVIALTLIAANIAFRVTQAIRQKESVVLQKTVGFMLVNIILIDAAMTFCFTGRSQLAAVVVILVVPATLLKRRIPMS